MTSTANLLAQLGNLDLRRQHVGQQDVALAQLGLGVWPQQNGGHPALALDRQQVDAEHAQRQFLQPLADQRRTGGYPHAVFAVGQPVAADPVAQARLAGTGQAVRVAAAQPAPGEHHVDDAKDQQRQAKWRKAEEVEPGGALPDQLGVDH
jgi:hypothetical protein